MNDLVTAEAAEARLQRTLMRRAEDVAAGDGAAWDPVGTVSAFGDRSVPARRRSSVRLLAAAAVAVGLGVTAIGLSALGEDEPSGSVVAADGGDATDATTAPTVGPTAPNTPSTTTPPTTASPEDRIETPVGTFASAADGAVVRIEWLPEVALSWKRPPGSEDLQAGGYPANYWEIPDQRTSMLKLFFDDGVLYLSADRLSMRDELVAFAEGIHRRPGTTDFEVSPPPGYAPT